MVAFNTQINSENDSNQPDSNKPQEGLVYSTTRGIYLYRGDQKNPKEDDVLIAPVGYSDQLCYHIGNCAPDGALFDSGRLDFSRIRNNRIKIMGGPIASSHGIFNTLTNELVSRPPVPNSVHVFCSSGRELFDAGIDGDPVNGYTIYFRNTLSGEDLNKKYGLEEHVTALCSHEGELIHGTYNGKIRRGKEIIAERKGLISGLASVKGVLYDGVTLSLEEGKGEIRETLTGKVVKIKKTTHCRSPKLISFNGALLDLSYTRKHYELRETFANRVIPIGGWSYSMRGDIRKWVPISAVCSIGPNLVKRILERTGW